MNVILHYDDHDIHTHDTVYALAKKQMTPDAYTLLTEASPYRKQMALDAGEFNLQMPFYVVKPLYTYTGFVFHKMGVPLLRATVIPSIIGYFFIGLLLFYWMQGYVHYSIAFALSLLAMISPPMLEAVTLSSPDCLSACMVLFAVYFILERKQGLWASLFLLLAIFARLDNVMPVVIIISALAFTSKLGLRISIRQYLLCMLLVLVSYFVVVHNAYAYGWDLLYFTTFFKHMNLGYDIHAVFSFNNYLALVRAQVMSGLFYSHLMFFVFLIACLFISKSQVNFRRLDAGQFLGLLFVLIIICRFVLQPVIADRFYLGYYIVVVALLVKRFAGRAETI